jgi:uncharacterized membrane protein YeiH
MDFASLMPSAVLAANPPIDWGGFVWHGHFTTIDLIAASTNALNGAMLVRSPDHYKRYTMVGIVLFAILGGIGGGVTRDVLVSEVPAALTNPAYLTLCLIAGLIGYFVAFDREQKFRMGWFQFMTAFSLPWYAIVGAQKGVDVGLPGWGCLLLAVVGPTAGRWFIDISSSVTPAHFIRGEWFVGTAVLTGAVWLAAYQLGGSTWVCAGVAFIVGFAFRVAATRFGWEEPMPKQSAAEPTPAD